MGWAFFLGASWTWCIGMFFPVLLIREFNVWGWIVFAFPNVLGSAVVGAVLQNVERSKKLLSQHTPAALLFSIVTIAFHVFFIGWKIAPLVGLIPATATFFLAGIFYAIGGGTRRDLVLAVIAIALSLVAMGIALTQDLGNATLLSRADPSPGLIALAPVCMIGFFLCPYLDLTYHRARQSTTPMAGVRAFQIGFAGPFLAMIVFTLLYARWIDGGRENLTLRWTIGLHMIIQAAFTLALHGQSLITATSQQFAKFRIGLIGAIVIAMGLAWFALNYRAIASHDVGEAIYLCFMGCYGIVFPAYVLLCMIPTAAKPAAPDRKAWLRVAMVSVAVFPFYWMGLIEHQVWWLLPGAGILIASRWVFRPKPAQP